MSVLGKKKYHDCLIFQNGKRMVKKHKEKIRATEENEQRRKSV